MNLEQLIKKYQGSYRSLLEKSGCETDATTVAREIAFDLIALQTEVKEKLEAMKSPRSHLNPVLILKELIE